MIGSLGNLVEPLLAKYGEFEINILLFADDAQLVADSEEMFCRRLSEFSRVCEIRTLFLVNIGKSKVMKCSRYVYVGGIVLRLYDEP